MRIGIVTSSYPRTPTESVNAGVFVRDVALGLASRGHDITVMTPQRVTTADVGINVRRIWWPGNEPSLTHIDLSRSRNAIPVAAMLVSGIVTVPLFSHLRRLNHLIAMWAVPSGVFSLATLGIRRVPYSVWALGSDIWNIKDYPLGPWMLRQVLRHSSYLYADGMKLAADVEAIAHRPCEFLASSCELPVTTAPSLPLDGTHRVVCVARYHPNKGIDVFIDAVGLLPERHRKHLSVVIRGDGPDESKLRCQIERLGLKEIIDLGGPVDRRGLAELLAGADLAVVPSRIESIPLILSDIARANTPMIVTDVGDMGKLVQSHGAGAVVPAEDPHTLALALAGYIDDAPPGNHNGRHALANYLDVGRSVSVLSSRILSDGTERTVSENTRNQPDSEIKEP